MVLGIPKAKKEENQARPDMRRMIDVLSHYLHGSLAGFLTVYFRWFGLAIAVFLFIQFISYEVSEEMKTKDELYLELKEWSMGFTLALTMTFLLVTSLLSFPTS